MYLGIDIGGTFTDLVLMEDEGGISTAKALTTPGELEIGVFDAVDLAARAKTRFPTGTPGWVRADDIVTYKPPARASRN